MVSNAFDAGLGITAPGIATPGITALGITALGITTLGITTQGSARIAQAASHFHRSTSTPVNDLCRYVGSFTDAEARRLASSAL